MSRLLSRSGRVQHSCQCSSEPTHDLSFSAHPRNNFYLSAPRQHLTAPNQDTTIGKNNLSAIIFTSLLITIGRSETGCGDARLPLRTRFSSNLMYSGTHKRRQSENSVQKIRLGKQSVEHSVQQFRVPVHAHERALLRAVGAAVGPAGQGTRRAQ